MKLTKTVILGLLVSAVLGLAGCGEKSARVHSKNCLHEYDQNSRAYLYIGGDSECVH